MADDEELAPFDENQVKDKLEKYELLDSIGTGPGRIQYFKNFSIQALLQKPQSFL